MSDINRNCKECGDFVKNTHEGVPFVDGTAMCMDCFTEDYIHYGKKVLDAIERGGLFDEEVETSDEQWFDDPEWIEMNRGEPFEVAWDSIAKNDFRLFPTDICNDCGIDVSKETGINVNRIPADTIQGLYPGGFEQFTEDRQGYGILSRYNPETLRWIFDNPSEVDTGWRCALCEVDAYADMEAPDHPEVEDGLWNTALAMDLSSKNTLHYQEFMERFGHLKEHHPDVFNMIEQRINLRGEGDGDFQASADPFDAGWDSITKFDEDYHENPEGEKDPFWVMGGLSDQITFEGTEEVDCVEMVRRWLMSINYDGYMRTRDNPLSGQLWDHYSNEPAEHFEAFLRQHDFPSHKIALQMLEDCREAVRRENEGEADMNLPPIHFSEFNDINWRWPE